MWFFDSNTSLTAGPINQIINPCLRLARSGPSSTRRTQLGQLVELTLVPPRDKEEVPA